MCLSDDLFAMPHNPTDNEIFINIFNHNNASKGKKHRMICLMRHLMSIAIIQSSNIDIETYFILNQTKKK